MARQVLPIVGAIVGGYLGGPQGAQIGFAIGSLVGNAVDPQIINGPKIGEAGLQTSAEGVYRPIVYGTGPVKGNIISRGNRQIHTQRETQGKGGPVTETERVYWTFAIRISEGPIGGILRVWQDEKLVYDVTPSSTIPAESAEFLDRCRFYLGDEAQLPDPDLEAFMGMGNVSAYRGSSLAIFPNFDLTDYRERIPDFRFEVSNEAASPYSYLALLHMDEKFTDTSEHLRDEMDPARWSPGGDLIPATFPFGVNAVQIHDSSDIAKTNYDFASAIGVNAFHISAWIYRDSAGDPGHIYDCILGHWFAPGTRSFQWNIGRTGLSDLMQVALSTDGENITNIYGDTPVPYDEWVFVAITRDSSGQVRLFQQVGSTAVLVAQAFWPHELHSNTGSVPGENWGIGGFDEIPALNIFYGMIKELVIISGDPIYVADFPVPTAPWPNPTSMDGTKIPLADIVSDLHSRANQDSTFYDVSELTDMVDGLVLAADYTCADAIRTLMPVYFYDSTEHDSGSGYRIHYPKRGKPVVLTITEDQIINGLDRTVREDAFERPRTIHLAYENPTIGYAPAKATITRDSPDIKVVGERSVQVPVTFSDVTEVRQIAHKLFKIIWVEVAGEEELSLSDNYLQLVPGDCIGVSIRGQLRRMRITQEMLGPGEQSYKLIRDRQSAYTSAITGIPVPAPTPPIPSIAGPTIMAFGDWPALNDNNDRLLYYVGATGQTDAWYGALIQRAVDPDTTFQDATAFNLNTIMGTLVDNVSDASEHYIDTTNQVRVSLYTNDTIDSLTDQQFLSEGGSFALENPDGSWELMQYRDAYQESSGDWVLSYLARGRLNNGTSAHLSGAMFVLLDGVRSVDASSGWINRDLTHRAISFGSSPDGVPTQTDPYIGKSQIEFPVADILGEITGSTIDLRAIPRHRFGTEDNPIRSINWTGYRWSLTDGVNSQSQDTLSDTISFDITGWTPPVTVTVSQLNRITGSGPQVTEQFE